MDNVCFRFIYFELSAIKPKPPRGFTGIEFAAFHPVLIAPSHITRDGLALFLSKSSVDGGDEFTTHIDSIDAFTLETDVDTQLFQFTDILKAVLGVAGKAGDRFAYGDNVMYKTTAYGENVYSWLVIVDKNEAFTVATAEANITKASATAEEVKQSYDVNETGVVDINDAQLTYDIYSGKYTDFEKVSVRKFLRADVNLDKAVNSTDAVAVVKNSK